MAEINGTEPVAIVGIGCRFPGASGPDGFWRLLADGVDAITEVPADRWNLDELYDQDPAVPGKMNTRWGGFVGNVAEFDAAFFGISPREATHIDPQQRLLMEVAWEALEDAGMPVDKLAGQPVGVFVGMSSFDYACAQVLRVDEIRDGYINTGSALSIGANRLSYLFDFRGPSVVIDTACSSSLVAAYYACQSVRRGESRIALAGGVNLILSPAVTIGFSKLQAMAPDGRCKAFDARANGYVRGEGAGVVVLKLLSAAVADGDRVYAVIRGGAINQDGRTNGLTAPNGLSQQALVRDALANAGVQPSEIQYVEAHGTGTPLGDPIELNALGAALAPGRPRGARCAVGSAKTNVGHLEAAAGIAGLIKLALSLEHRQLPANLHFEKPNPYIRFDVLPLRVVTNLEPWPAGPGVARGGVSAFGFGGTNAHLVLEEAPSQRAGQETGEDDACVLPLSARSEAALSDLARAWVARLADESSVSLGSMCATAAVRRSHHDVRLAAVASSRSEMAATLSAFLAGEKPREVEAGRRAMNRRRKVAFVFPGQGSQWIGMGRELVRREPVFAAAIEACAAAFAAHVEWSLTAQLDASPETSRLEDVDVVQPAIFAIQVALAELWRSWGIKPDAVVGHSMGEVAAAHVAGALSLVDAARIICRRSRLARRTSGMGAMAVVELSFARATEILVGYEDRLAVAVSNSPTSTVLSGDPPALEEILVGLERAGVFCRRVKVDYASHSPQMDALRDDLLSMLSGLTPLRTKVPLYSTVTCAVMSGPDLGAEYWARNLREPVRFAAVIEKLLEAGVETFLEISPHPILLSSIQQCLLHVQRDGTVLASLRRDEGERRSLLSSVSSLYAIGKPVEWAALYQGVSDTVPMPAYPWQRTRFWFDDENGAPAAGSRGRFKARNPLIGDHIQSAAGPGIHLWQRELDVRAFPFLADHRVQGEIVVPATVYLEMALEAAREALGDETSFALTDVRFEKALVLSEAEARLVQVVLTRQLLTCFEWQVFGQAPGGSVDGSPTFVRHARGLIRVSTPPDNEADARVESPAAIQARCSTATTGADHYRLLSEAQLDYGPSFQGIDSVWAGEREALASLKPAPADARRYQLHPALLDSAFQALAETQSVAAGRTLVPIALDRLELRTPTVAAPVVWAHAALTGPAGRGGARVRLLTEAGAVIAEATGIRLEPLGGVAPAELPELYTLEWELQPLAPAAAADRTRTILIFTDSAQGVGRRLAERIVMKGGRPILVERGPSQRIPTDVDTGMYRIGPATAHEYSALLDDLASRDVVLDAIVHVWSLDVDEAGDEAADLGWGSVLLLVQALARRELDRSPRLWLTTRRAQRVRDEDDVSPFQAPLWGLARTIVQEHPELSCTAIDVSAADDIEIGALADELWQNDREPQVAIRPDGRFVARLTRLNRSSDGPEPGSPKRATRDVPFCAHVERMGDLSSVAFRPVARRRPAADEVEIEVVAAGLNFRDALFALGLLPATGDIVLGHECAGRISAVGDAVTGLSVGDDVVALAKPTLSSFVRARASLVVPKPSRLDFEEAATLPIAFLTAYHAIHDLGRVRRGERVLIHSATGAVGLACIRLAQEAGAEIYATAGTEQKRRLLESLSVRRAMDSRALDFADEVLESTGGEGVDVVVNTVAGEALARGLSILRPGGRFIELGKRDLLEGGHLPLRALEESRSFFLVDLNSLAEKRPDVCGRLLREALRVFEDSGLAPLPRQVFAASELSDALQLMARSQHIGKIVVRMDQGDVTLGPPSDAAARIRDDATYVLTGGLGGIALVVGRWLVEKGARHLVLVGRGEPTAHARHVIDGMERAGARVVVDRFDVSEAADVETAFERWARDWPPVHGIVHAAGVLDDGILIQQTPERFRRVMAPKIQGAWNLHRASFGLPLDFFLLFSSAASVLGSAGQSGYAAANQFLDALAHYRRARTLPVTTINWGPWSEVGLAARADRGGRLEVGGIKSLAPSQGLAALEEILLANDAQVTAMRVDWAEWGRSYPRLSGSPVFSRLQGAAAARGTLEAPDSTRATLLSLTPDERIGWIAERLRHHTSSVLRLAEAKIDLDQPLTMMGIDSLMAVELKSRVEREIGVTIPLLQLIKGPSLSELANTLARSLHGDPATASDQRTPAAASGERTGKSLLLSILSLKDGE